VVKVSGRGFRVLPVVVAAFALVVLAVPATSAGSLFDNLLPSCGVETYPFAQWADPDAYCAFANVGFENGTDGWTLAGDASIASANEPWDVSGPGTSALSLGPGATALSSPLPISVLDPWVRFFARNGAANGSLQVQALFSGPLGNTTGVLNLTSLSIAGFANWQPTQRALSALAVPLGTTAVQVLLTSKARHGDWLVDDVYLDPCVSRVG
jgi:hypothetical protein